MNSNANKIYILIRDFFAKYFEYQHPETALRYLPVVDTLKRAKLQNSRILEIGSGSLGITPYLKKRIDGLDVDFSGPRSPLVNKIKGSAQNLPFRKNAYDVVIAVDVIEHLDKNIREQAIFEILRVAQKLAILVVPVGELSEKQDRQLDERWKRIFKTPNQFLEEHVKNGLPKTEEILVQLDRASRKLKKTCKINSRPLLNLRVRNFLMKTWISKNKFFYYLYLKGYLLLLPVLRLCNFGDCYRRIFVIEFASPAKDRSSSRATISR